MSPRTAGVLSLVGLSLAAPAAARAQACCAGASAISPGRLADHEDALVGAEARGRSLVGTHDSTGAFRRAPRGTSETEARLTMIGTARLLERGQLSLLVPTAWTRRVTPGRAESSVGLGDLEARARLDVTRTGASRTIPGLALVAGVLAPTGRSVANAKKPLGTDATGAGTWEASVGAAGEKTLGPWLVSAAAFVAMRREVEVAGVSASLAPRWSGLVAAAYTFESEAALAVSMIHTRAGESTIGGRTVPDSATRTTTVALAGQAPLSEAYRVSATLSAAPPLSGLGKNAPAPVGITLALFRTWM